MTLEQRVARMRQLAIDQMDKLYMGPPEFSMGSVVRNQENHNWGFEIHDVREPFGSQIKWLTLEDGPYTDESVSEWLAAQLAELKSSN
jgi:hypothetical protein